VEIRPTPLYLAAGLRLSFEAPQPGEAQFDGDVSDPAKPGPFRARPIQPIGCLKSEDRHRHRPFHFRRRPLILGIK
jgi:hypothetical protein